LKNKLNVKKRGTINSFRLVKKGTRKNTSIPEKATNTLPDRFVSSERLYIQANTGRGGKIKIGVRENPEVGKIKLSVRKRILDHFREPLPRKRETIFKTHKKKGKISFMCTDSS